jgi:hypothetical protein
MPYSAYYSKAVLILAARCQYGIIILLLLFFIIYGYSSKSQIQKRFSGGTHGITYSDCPVYFLSNLQASVAIWSVICDRVALPPRS